MVWRYNSDLYAAFYTDHRLYTGFVYKRSHEKADDRLHHAKEIIGPLKPPRQDFSSIRRAFAPRPDLDPRQASPLGRWLPHFAAGLSRLGRTLIRQASPLGRWLPRFAARPLAPALCRWAFALRPDLDPRQASPLGRWLSRFATGLSALCHRASALCRQAAGPTLRRWAAKPLAIAAGLPHFAASGESLTLGIRGGILLSTRSGSSAGRDERRGLTQSGR